MMADHGEPCSDSDASYCMNGGTCYKIHTVDTPTCHCSDSFKGSRCEQFQLFSTSDTTEKGLIAAIAIIVLLVLILLAVVIYYICKMRRTKEPKKQSTTDYWRVKPRGHERQEGILPTYADPNGTRDCDQHFKTQSDPS